MSTLINHLLAHHLATNETALFNSIYILGVLQTERIITKCEAEEGLGGPVMHRWNLRIASLISPQLLPPIRTFGFQLIHSTFTSSTNSLLSQSKTTLTPALNYISTVRPDPSLFIECMKVLQLILGRSTWHNEWARDVVGASVVQKTVQSLITAANGTISEIKLPCINTIVSLLPLFPTPLRPLSPALHTLALDCLCNSSGSIPLINTGSNLFVSLYLLAPKGRDGLREAWKKGIEALIGSIDILIPNVTSNIFAEDPLTNHSLPPLALPSLINSSPVAALGRVEALIQALCCSLRTPTSEKTGAVEIPIGALVELGVRLVGMSVDMPVKERTDPTTLIHTLSLLPRLQVSGCQLLAQVSLCVGPKMVAHATEMLGVVSRTLSTYTLRSPMRPTLSTTYSIIHNSLGSSIDPEDGKKSLARVWRSVLEDIGSIAIEPIIVVNSDEKGGPNTRKNKRQKTFDPSESMDLAGRRVRLDQVDLDIASRGLATLERLLSSPHSHFLPPKLQLATVRLLLAISLDPAFFSSHPTTGENSTYFPATSASKGMDIAKQNLTFRRGVILCLKASLEGAASATGGLPERAAEVWRRGSFDNDDVIKSLCINALSKFITLIHPALPPLQVNTTFERLKLERLGGNIGDEISIRETSEEFRFKSIKVNQFIKDTDQVMTSTEEEEEEGVVVPSNIEEISKVSVLQTSTTTTNGFSTTSFPTFGATGFPSFTSKLSDDIPAPTTTTTTSTLDIETSLVPGPPSFNSAPSTNSSKGKKNVVPVVVQEEDSDSDDFVMPKIVDDDSSDEE